MNDFDPNQLHIGDVIVFRKVVELPVPGAANVTAISPVIEIPPLGIDPSRYLSSVSHVWVDPENPRIIHLVGVVSFVSDEVLDYQARIVQEAKTRALELALGDMEEDAE